MRFLVLSLSLVTSLVHCQPVVADYIISLNRVGAEFVQQNSLVSFDVRLSAPLGTPTNRLTAFTLFFDIGDPVGKGTPVGLGPVTVTNYLTGFTSSLGNQVDTGISSALSSANFDFSVNAENTSGIELDSSVQPTLFRLNINTGTAATRQYSLVFRNDPIGEGFSLRSNFPPLTGQGDFGTAASSSVLSSTFTVNVVPEPGSYFLGCAGALLAGTFARCRRNTRGARKLQ